MADPERFGPADARDRRRPVPPQENRGGNETRIVSEPEGGERLPLLRVVPPAVPFGASSA